MKKVLFALTAVLLFSGVSFGQVRTAPVSESQKFHIEFGRPSKNCEGFGICSIDIDAEDIIMIIQAIFKNGKVTLKFPADFYKANQAKFPGGYFQLDESYTPPTTVSRAVTGVENYTFKQGKYLVTFDPGSNTYNCTF